MASKLDKFLDFIYQDFDPVEEIGQERMDAYNKRIQKLIQEVGEELEKVNKTK